MLRSDFLVNARFVCGTMTIIRSIFIYASIVYKKSVFPLLISRTTIAGKYKENVASTLNDDSPGDEGCVDMTSSCISGGSIE